MFLRKNVIKHFRHVKSKGTMTKWPVHRKPHRATHKHVEHQDATDIFVFLERKRYIVADNNNIEI